MSTEGGHWRMPSSAAATVKPFVIAFVAVAAICMLSIPASSLHKNGGLRMNSPGISRTGVVGVRRGDCALGKTSRRHHHLQNHIHKSSDVPAHALASQSEGVNRARIEFVEGVAEQAIPEIRLTRSRDGLSGVASFKFERSSHQHHHHHHHLRINTTIPQSPMLSLSSSPISPKVLVNNPGEVMRS
uniref:Photosystem II reaction center Psb28 protein n=1 Tax=Lotharella globosa TaxID=91324 RepID=A0A6V3LK67_9EUKA